MMTSTWASMALTRSLVDHTDGVMLVGGEGVSKHGLKQYDRMFRPVTAHSQITRIDGEWQ